MSERVGGIIQEAQRDPSGGELLIGAPVFRDRRGGIARETIGGLRILEVEQLAHEKPAFDPPFVGVMDDGGILRRLEHQLARHRPTSRRGAAIGRG